MKPIKRIFAGLLAAVTVALCLSPAGAALQSSAKHSGALGNVSGQTSKTERTLFPGVTATHYTLGSGTAYGLQDLQVVEFDPRQEELSFHVTTGGTTLDRLSTVKNTVAAFQKNNPDKLPICAINGDWYTIASAQARVEGSGTSFGGYDDPVVKKSLSVPLGFNMQGGEIVTTSQIPQETPWAGWMPSFGITPDGTALIGEILADIRMNLGGGMISIDGINRLPANDAIVLYTDKGPASNYCLDDAFELYIDFDTDYTVRHGMRVTGTLTAISRPGEARQAMKENRMIVTARGSRIPEIADAAVGAQVSLRLSITDNFGNSALWQTVDECVGGHHVFARDGEYFTFPDDTNYPATLLGVTAEGKVMMLCNDGRQSGYSVGIRISKMNELARELGIVSGLYMDGGGSATMLCRNAMGDMELTNRPCYGERAVSNAVILAYTPLDTTDYTFDSPIYETLIGTGNNAAGALTEDGLQITSTAAFDPYLRLTGIRHSADTYKYLVLDVKTTYRSTQAHPLSLFLSAGKTTWETGECMARLRVPATGENERLLVDLSALSLWEGDIHSIRIDLFDDDPAPPVGEGVVLRRLRLFSTLKEAQAAMEPDVLIGDVNGDGSVTTADVSMLRMYLTGVDVQIHMDAADVNGDGSVTTADVTALRNRLTGQ